MPLRIPPEPFDPARAERVKAALAEQGFSSPEPLLDSVFGNSPYLGRLAQREIGALGEYLAAGPETVLNAAILLAHACVRAESEAQAMKELRTAKCRAALAIAMADIAGTWDVNWLLVTRLGGVMIFDIVGRELIRWVGHRRHHRRAKMEIPVAGIAKRSRRSHTAKWGKW